MRVVQRLEVARTVGQVGHLEIGPLRAHRGDVAREAAATHGGSTGTGGASVGSSIGRATRSIEMLTLRASAGTACSWISSSSIRVCAHRYSVPTSWPTRSKLDRESSGSSAGPGMASLQAETRSAAAAARIGLRRSCADCQHCVFEIQCETLTSGRG